jgi:[FeFe] hydrogenase H-cluster maturation GTPase HydF
MQKEPKSFRLHIGIFGRRNSGKSSLLNAITRQSISIVSHVPGTTTDPVEKPMELLPIGPVLFIDTAGVDDTGDLGQMRIEKTKTIFDRTELAIVVASEGQWTDFEDEILAQLDKRQIPAMIVFNKIDVASPSRDVLDQLAEKKHDVVLTNFIDGKGVDELREKLVENTPEDFMNTPAIVGNLVGANNMAVLVTPIDLEAPKGRIILPQVQTLRDLLDHDAYCLVVKEHQLKPALDNLKSKPALVVTDSQAFVKVAEDTPDDVPMTSFSILFARFKGDLNEFVNGALAIDSLKDGDKVLIAESCTHHPIGEDIGRIQIPRFLKEHTGVKLDIEITQGHDFPQDLAKYKLVIQCGGCMWNRKEMLSRIMHCRAAGVSITNYGIVIAYTHGIFERALRPFKDSLDRYNCTTT